MTRTLSPMQEKATQLLAEGMNNNEIAAVLGTTANVIKNVFRIVFDKTGMNNRLELALWWVSRH